MARDKGVMEAQKAFSKGKVGPVVLLSGPERMYAEELVRVLLEALIPEDFRVFNFNRYRAGQDSFETILTGAGTLPMFCERRLICVQDANSLSRSDSKHLADYIKSPSPSTVMVITTEETGQKVPAVLRKIPEKYVLWRPFPRDAVQWMVRRAAKHDKELPLPVAEELFALCAGDSGDGRAALSDLAKEVEKICLLVGERPRIVADDLNVVGRHAEARVLYQIEATVAERNLPGALAALSAALLFPRENGAIRIVAMLGERFRKMLMARDRMNSGYSVQATMAGMWFPGAGSTHFLKSVGLFSRDELATAVTDLARLDRALKTGQANPDSVHLEAFLHRVCMETH